MRTCPACPLGMTACRRCGARACMEHQPTSGAICNACELAYHESKRTLRLNAWFALGFAMPWVFVLGIHEHLPSWSARSGGFRAITTGVPMIDVLIMATVTAVFAGKIAMVIRTALHRERFITAAERTLAR
jgi:cation transport ATPase